MSFSIRKFLRRGRALVAAAVLSGCNVGIEGADEARGAAAAADGALYDWYYAFGDSITFGHSACPGTDCNYQETILTGSYPRLYAVHPENALRSEGFSSDVYCNYALSGTRAHHDPGFSLGGLKNRYVIPCGNSEYPVTPDLDPGDGFNWDNAFTNAIGGEALVPAIQSQTWSSPHSEHWLPIRPHSKVTFAYGRNDINSGAVTREAYRQALQTMLEAVDATGSTHEISFLTLLPMNVAGWRRWAPVEKRDQRWHPFTTSSAFPHHIDSFYSAVAWEVAHEHGVNVVPVHEYMTDRYDRDYLSVDDIHPGAFGHRVLRDLLLNEDRPVVRTEVEGMNRSFSIEARSRTYGQIVFYEADGSFYYSEPFAATGSRPFLFRTLPGKRAVVYSSRPIVITEPASQKIGALRRDHYNEEHFRVAISRPERILPGSAEVYLAPVGLSDDAYCRESTWTPIPGSIHDGFFISSQSAADTIGATRGAPRRFWLVMNYRDRATGHNYTGNPAGRCFDPFFANSGLRSRVDVHESGNDSVVRVF